MRDDSKESEDAWARQEREQILFKARNTTPLQRIQWLEETRRTLAAYLTRPNPESPASRS
jgi:hypothetical protein